jgi:Protein of unknown function (DUF3987)
MAERGENAVAHGRAPPDRPADADPPVLFRAMAMDVTTEELQRMLAEQPRGMLYARDELAGWLGAHDKYGGNGADRAFFLEAWNGGHYVSDRVKHHGAPIRIERTSLAILGGLTLDHLAEVLRAADDGLAARFIFLWPVPVAIEDLRPDHDPAAEDRHNRLLDAARRLVGLGMADDRFGGPTPKVLRLAGDAFDLFQTLRRDAINKARKSRGIAAGWHGKNPARLLRLALNYEMLAWSVGSGSEPATVSADATARAGRFVDYAAAMFDRVIAGLAIDRAEADAAVVARAILESTPLDQATDQPLSGMPPCRTLNERKLYQRLTWLRDTERRRAALEVLANAGWIRPARPKAGSIGRPPGDWEVNPRLSEKAIDE